MIGDSGDNVNGPSVSCSSETSSDFHSSDWSYSRK